MDGTCLWSVDMPQVNVCIGVTGVVRLVDVDTTALGTVERSERLVASTRALLRRGSDGNIP